jgi:hypothetical protein
MNVLRDIDSHRNGQVLRGKVEKLGRPLL